MKISVIFAGLLIWISGSEAVCPDGYVQVQSKCFKSFTNELSWDLAQSYCKETGGILATIQQESYQDGIASQIQSLLNETTLSLSTSNVYKYHYMHDEGLDVLHHTSVNFEVKACNDAFIALSTDKGIDDNGTYEIVIGGWADSVSAIRNCKQCKQLQMQRHQNHPLSCTEYRPFWISWTNSTIRVGKGHVTGQKTFLSWYDHKQHPVNYLAFATGWGASGNWRFNISTFEPGMFWVGGTVPSPHQQNQWSWQPSGDKFTYSNWASNSLPVVGQCVLMDISQDYQWMADNCDEYRNFVCEMDQQNNLK